MVKFQPVTLGPNRGNLVEIVNGMAAGDRVITDGILKVQPDMAIKPMTFKLEAPSEGSDGEVS